MDVEKLSNALLMETEKIIVGKTDKIRKIIMAILSGGHVLIDDLPGVGKTTLVKTISIAAGCEYGRIQFVSDMLPSDIIGMNIYNQKSGDFELRKGPIMTNILLADEINRAIPRTQSALLEAMEEHQVTIDGKSFPLPSPFIVLATENPVEAESTFHLPVAQMDRFLISLSIGYPEEKEEEEMLRIVGDEIPFEKVNIVADASMIEEAQMECRRIHVSDPVNSYIVAITTATRKDNRVRMGASPRASRALYQASKAWAAMNGRKFVTPDDIKEIAHDVLDHRVLLEDSVSFSGIKVSQIIDEILEKTEPSPTVKDLLNEK